MPTPVLHDLIALAAQIAAATGIPVAIDPQLRLPACGHPPIVAPGAGSVGVECTAPAWRIVVAGTAATARPLIRRGDAVAVAAAGPGFSVSIGGVAENDAAVGGRLRVRDATSGTRLSAIVVADGSVALAGYNPDAGGR